MPSRRTAKPEEGRQPPGTTSRRECERIIEGMSPVELSDYSRLGGILPMRLLMIAQAYERGEYTVQTIDRPKPTKAAEAA